MVSKPPTPIASSADSFDFTLGQPDIEDFRAILLEECGEDLSLAEAWTRAMQVLALFRFFLEWEQKRPQKRTLEPSGGS